MVATRANSASEVRTTTSFPSLLGMGDSVFNHYYFLVLLGNFKSFLIITDTKFRLVREYVRDPRLGLNI